jgi:sensor histidine kinase regulating citrate/malate metabolism
MSVVLSNVLQNAMEASEEIQNPLILVTSMVRGNVFILSVKNRMKDKLTLNEDGIPDSSKNDSAHGYGLKNIRSIATRYKGDIEIKQENRDGYYVFVLNVMMIG